MFEDEEENVVTDNSEVRNDHAAAEVSGASDVVVVDADETLHEHTAGANNVTTEVTSSSSVAANSDLDRTADDFVEGTITVADPEATKESVKVKKQSKGKKRKAADSVDSTDNEEGSVCTICFEDWSNSGDHR